MGDSFKAIDDDRRDAWEAKNKKRLEAEADEKESYEEILRGKTDYQMSLALKYTERIIREHEELKRKVQRYEGALKGLKSVLYHV